MEEKEQIIRRQASELIHEMYGCLPDTADTPPVREILLRAYQELGRCCTAPQLILKQTIATLYSIRLANNFHFSDEIATGLVQLTKLTKQEEKTEGK